jgi:hypothetical protein
MSLTTDEWIEMWESIKLLEDFVAGHYDDTLEYDEARSAVKNIKKKIQQVMGQME